MANTTQIKVQKEKTVNTQDTMLNKINDNLARIQATLASIASKESENSNGNKNTDAQNIGQAIIDAINNKTISKDKARASTAKTNQTNNKVTTESNKKDKTTSNAVKENEREKNLKGIAGLFEKYFGKKNKNSTKAQTKKSSDNLLAKALGFGIMAAMLASGLAKEIGKAVVAGMDRLIENIFGDGGGWAGEGLREGLRDAVIGGAIARKLGLPVWLGASVGLAIDGIKDVKKAWDPALEDAKKAKSTEVDTDSLSKGMLKNTIAGAIVGLGLAGPVGAVAGAVVGLLGSALLAFSKNAEVAKVLGESNAELIDDRRQNLAKKTSDLAIDEMEKEGRETYDLKKQEEAKALRVITEKHNEKIARWRGDVQKDLDKDKLLITGADNRQYVDFSDENAIYKAAEMRWQGSKNYNMTTGNRAIKAAIELAKDSIFYANGKPLVSWDEISQNLDQAYLIAENNLDDDTEKLIEKIKFFKESGKFLSSSDVYTVQALARATANAATAKTWSEKTKANEELETARIAEETGNYNSYGFGSENTMMDLRNQSGYNTRYKDLAKQNQIGTIKSTALSQAENRFGYVKDNMIKLSDNDIKKLDALQKSYTDKIQSADDYSEVERLLAELTATTKELLEENRKISSKENTSPAVIQNTTIAPSNTGNGSIGAVS